MNINLSITLRSVRWFIVVLLLIEFLFGLVFLCDVWLFHPVGEGHYLFDLDGEMNIPAWFSSVQLFLIGILLLISSGHRRSAKSPSPLFLFLSGMGFIFLSADEATYLHETITSVLRSFAFFPRFAGGQGIWIPLYGTIGICLLLVVRRQLVKLWKNYRRAAALGVTGATIFLTGAVVLEVIGYEFLHGNRGFLYDLEVAFEEFFEMMGASIILYAVVIFESLRQDETASSKVQATVPELKLRQEDSDVFTVIAKKRASN